MGLVLEMDCLRSYELRSFCVNGDPIRHHHFAGLCDVLFGLAEVGYACGCLYELVSSCRLRLANQLAWLVV
jgi:hypothetical protein